MIDYFNRWFFKGISIIRMFRQQFYLPRWIIGSKQALAEFAVNARTPKFRPVIRYESQMMVTHKSKSTSHNEARSNVGDRLQKNHDITKIRNIGIMAHIDAGKTTTTERMLFHSGITKHIGDVDDGDTVMDYMVQERNRGITIQSAAITFTWQGHHINLIDTPGHVDFTMEVERALRVLDGAVAILDASAGVEAQTVTVWRQADKNKLPRLIFINKMDKKNASFDASLASICEKLGVVPIPIQYPLGSGKTFEGHIDLITMETVVWSNASQLSNGVEFSRKPLCGDLRQTAYEWRINLIDNFAHYDEILAERVINDGYDDITPAVLNDAIRRVTSSVRAIPVLCGTSLRNTGVQSLLDAVVNYLPDPTHKPLDNALYYGSSLSSLAFKIIHDEQRGPLTFLRLYSGQISSGASLYNVNRGVTEKTSRLLRAYADEFKDIASACAGDIVLVTGLKEAMTGDTLVHSHRAMEKAREAFCLNHELNPDEQDSTPGPLLATVNVPDPVFLCTIEPPSLSQQKNLEHALQCLQREDPSFHVHTDPDSGQTVLSGMGELHLEIIQDRIRTEYNIDADLGPLQISYREAIANDCEHSGSLERTMADRLQKTSMKLLIRKSVGHGPATEVELIHTRDNELDKIKRPYLKAIEDGVLSALKQGPLLGFPVLDVEVELHEFSYQYGTTLAFISACASDTVLAALRKTTCILLEPMMALTVLTDEDYLSVTIADLSRRRAQISEVHGNLNARTVTATVPLSELLGYSTALRTITSGTASFSMEVTRYQPMTADEQNKTLQEITGCRV